MTNENDSAIILREKQKTWYMIDTRQVVHTLIKTRVNPYQKYIYLRTTTTFLNANTFFNHI